MDEIRDSGKQETETRVMFEVRMSFARDKRTRKKENTGQKSEIPEKI